MYKLANKNSLFIVGRKSRRDLWKFFVSAGEASGDLHILFVKSVKARYKDVDFVGWQEKSQRGSRDTSRYK